LIDSRLETAGGIIAALEPSEHRAWIEALSNSVRSVQEQGEYPVILCSEAARPLVKSSSEREIPDLAVLSVPEIAPDMKIESLGEIRMGEV
jgi:flagellar biosynthesis protein FlhA